MKAGESLKVMEKAPLAQEIGRVGWAGCLVAEWSARAMTVTLVEVALSNISVC